MLTIVSHDAGGAEILSNWVLQQTERYLLVIAGPAEKIFRKKLGDITVFQLEKAINESDWVLTGTSWKSDLEYNAIRYARENKKKSVSFLDHWVNYKQRFTRLGVLSLPDEIWVGDEQALSIARAELPSATVCLKSNPYFESLESELSEIRAGNTFEVEPYVLYVCSPVREHAFIDYGDENYWGYTEEDAIRYFMENLSALKAEHQHIVFRPHPSESAGKYDWLIKEYGTQVEIGGDKPLLEEIVVADFIIGCNSMAMVVGLLAGKRVINGLPPCRKKCNIPMPKIEHLSELIAAYHNELQ